MGSAAAGDGRLIGVPNHIGAAHVDYASDIHARLDESRGHGHDRTLRIMQHLRLRATVVSRDIVPAGQLCSSPCPFADDLERPPNRRIDVTWVGRVIEIRQHGAA
jgi:hypothetical protein